MLFFRIPENVKGLKNETEDTREWQGEMGEFLFILTLSKSMWDKSHDLWLREEFINASPTPSTVCLTSLSHCLFTFPVFFEETFFYFFLFWCRIMYVVHTCERFEGCVNLFVSRARTSRGTRLHFAVPRMATENPKRSAMHFYPSFLSIKKEESPPLSIKKNKPDKNLEFF